MGSVARRVSCNTRDSSAILLASCPSHSSVIGLSVTRGQNQGQAWREGAASWARLPDELFFNFATGAYYSRVSSSAAGHIERNMSLPMVFDPGASCVSSRGEHSGGWRHSRGSRSNRPAGALCGLAKESRSWPIRWSGTKRTKRSASSP